MKSDILLTAAAASALAAAAASAQTSPNPSGLLVDRDRPDRSPASVQPGTEGPGPLTAPGAVAPFVLEAVAVDGSSLAPERIQAAVQPFIGRTLDAEGLAGFQGAIAAAYAGSPWALPVITLDTSQTHRGVLRLIALEGRVDRVAITGDVDGDVELLRRYAAALAGEAPLSRATAERYFSLIGDIPGARVSTQLRPGAQPGTVDLDLGLTRTRWEFGYALDTRGAPDLGRTQVSVGAALNGGLRLGDQTRLTLVLPLEVDRFQYASLSHRHPVGWNGAAVTGTVGFLRTRPPGGVEGDAVTGGLVYSWPAIRGYQTNLVLSAGLDGVNSDSAIFGQQIATERTRVLRASAAWSRAAPRTALSASGTVSQGLDALGARGTAGLVDLDFTKVNARAQAVQAVGGSARFTAAATAQYSGDATPATEQFTLGGAEFGRGFSSALLAGDSGWGVRGEAAWHPPLRGVAAGSELYAFGDAGQVRINARPGLIPDTRRDLSSLGLGARVALGGRVLVEVEAAKAVDDPRPSGDDWRANFGLSARF